MRVPTSTYRLQFHAGFGFRNACDILDYLHALGVGDVYASPYFQAGLESTHGYDVANHNTFNPAIGGESEYRNFVSELRRRDMGQLLDFVPNHMGISESLNVWWMDVLENGLESDYARFFDIDWHPGKAALEEKIVLPILGGRYGKVLEAGELKPVYENGAFSVRYFDARLPVRPKSYPLILRRLAERLETSEREEVEHFAERFLQEPSPAPKADLAEWLAAHPRAESALQSFLGDLSGVPGDASTFDSLHELLEEQWYRLAYWRVAAEEINYRRFFDINTLAAIRVEIPEVFEASHQLVLELLARGDVTGLRIDHVDGLWNPREYLERLQSRHAEATGRPGDDQSLYVVVEKIVDSTREMLPENWATAGTTGYEFANQAVNVLVDASAVSHLTETYRRFTGVTDTFADLAYEKKRLVMETSFQSEVSDLGRKLDRLSELHRDYRDLTRNLLTSAVREVIGCFPVYRTYATPGVQASEADERAILRAMSQARRRNPAIEKPVFDFLRNLLLMRFPAGLEPDQIEAHMRFVMKFQQCTSPVTAKGVEDTALYVYHRLVALNEVGGNPGDFGIAVSDFHQFNAARRERTPGTLLATSTHDTKRSEDVRMRIAVLSEIPDRWRKAVVRWSRRNRRFRTTLGDESAPSSNEEYLLYQTLLGVWPLDEPFDRGDFTARIQAYMIKALKEAKVNSSWTEPNEDWESAVATFIARVIDERTGTAFQRDFLPLANDVARWGAWNSLSQTVLKCTVPGVPDIYQGTELWDLSLVDPDNRRPVDFERRARLLAGLDGVTPEDLVAGWRDGRIKMFVLRALLRLRRSNPEFFQRADYIPLEVSGPAADRVIAFRRELGGSCLWVVVPRLTARLGEAPIGGVWQSTAVIADGIAGALHVFTGNTATDARLEGLLGRFPVAVLTQNLRISPES
ncbi:MAG: malto-oligosyltrehalose synthase [Terrimicrobiaceae bacterium]|nr:malto-oligosyltrehalose synthase [Terrimicrobiaceae bacterium]